MVIAVVRTASILRIVIRRGLGLSLSTLFHSVSHLVLILFFLIQLILILILLRPSPLQLLLIGLPLRGTIHPRRTYGSRKNRENLLFPPQLHLRHYLHRLPPYFVRLLQPDISARTSSLLNFVNSRKSLMTISS